MGFNCGIIGLPNVGKSTLFNSLTSTADAEAANYPFCTIDPNVGRVGVPDARLEKLAALASSGKIIPSQLEFVDIAGLVKGASRGEGLGNKFLANIRETDAVLHVLRCFDGEVTHVEASVDPVRDAEIIDTELMLSDLESVNRRLENASRRARGGDEEAKLLVEILVPIKAALEEGKPVRSLVFDEGRKLLVKQLQLLSAKPVLYVCNVAEEDAAAGNDYSKAVAEMASDQDALSLTICAEFEAQLATLDTDAERLEYLHTIGLSERGLANLVREGYSLLNLITFFTVGPKETRAWTIEKGAVASRAAGVIHTDFQRGFIRAETVSCDEYIAFQGEAEVRSKGKMRSEGKDYIVQDGDIFHFRFNV